MNKVRIQKFESDYIKVSDFGSEIHWDITSHDKYGDILVEVVCGGCHRTRFVYKHSIIRSTVVGRQFTGLCRDCSSKVFKPPRNRANNPGQDNPSAKNGYSINGEGYKILSITFLSQDDQKLALPMSISGGTGATPRVAEHRLVMARLLGRPLIGSEIVHHINGDRLDNKIENLELLTRKSHPTGHSDEDLKELVQSRLENQRLYAILKEHGISL